MSILFAISVLAFSALLWAALSIARHVRASNRSGHSSSDSLSMPSSSPVRHFYHQPLADLNDPPFARRLHQQPTRSARQDDTAA